MTAQTSYVRMTLLILAALVGIFLMLERVSINQSSTLEQMLTATDREHIQRYRQLFDVESEVVLIALHGQGSAIPESPVSLQHALLQLPGVVAVFPASTIDTESAGGGRSLPLDFGTELILLLLAPGPRQLQEAKNLSRDIRETVQAGTHGGQPFSIAGLPQIREASWAIGARDTRLMLPLLVLVTLTVTWICFKSYAAMVLSLLLTTVTTGVCLALQLLLAAKINALVVLVVPVIWTIATLDAFHLYSRTAINAKRGHSRPAEQARRELLLPCLLTTLTTAGCFITLTLLDTSSLIVSFGMWCTGGALLALLLTFTLGNWLLSSHGANHGYPSWSGQAVLRAVQFSERHKKGVVIAWLFLAVGSLMLVPRLEVATSFPQVFTDDNEIAREITRLKTVTGSDLNPVEIILQATDAHGEDVERLGSAALLTSNYLRTIEEARLTLPIDTLDEQDIENLGEGWDTGAVVGNGPVGIGNMRNWLSKKHAAVRLQVFFEETSYSRKREIFSWLQHFDATMLDHHSLSFSGPGYYHHLTEQRGLRSLLLSSLLSLFIVAATLYWIVQRPIPLLVALCGSIVPAVLLAGGMAAAGIPWTIAMLPMPVLLLGLMNDDTIHISWRERKSDVEINYTRNAENAGPALLATTLVLSGAIATMALSGIQTNQYLGILIPCGLLLALLCNLTLLPALSSCLRKSSR